MKKTNKSAKVAQSTKVKVSNKVATKKDVATVENNKPNASDENFNFETLSGKYHKDILQIVLQNIGNINNVVEHNYTKENICENFKNIKESGIYKIDDKDFIFAVVKNVKETGIAKENTRNKRLYITLKDSKKVTYSDSKTTFKARLKTLFK